MRPIFLAVLFSCAALSSCQFVRSVSISKEALKQVDENRPDHLVEIPFVYKNDWIHLRLKVKQGQTNYDGYFIFDTGAFTELFDSCGALNVVTPNAMEIPVKGALGSATMQLRVAEDVTLELNQLRVKKTKTFVVPRPKMFPSDCIGMIGADFFHHCILQIDFQKECLRIIPEKEFSDNSQVLKFKTTRNHNPILYNVVIGGMEPQEYLFDLGSQQSIFIQKVDEPSLRIALKDSVLSYSIASSSSEPIDMSGRSIQSQYFVRYAKNFNGESCSDFEIAGIVNPEIAFKKPNLGLGFARKVFSTVTLDMPGHRFFYELKTDSSGIDRLSRDIYFKLEDSTFLIGPVLTTSCWYQQGIRPKQKVLRINGEDPNRYIEARKAGQEVTVTSITIITEEGERSFSRN
jgi:hypothetical protein